MGVHAERKECHSKGVGESLEGEELMIDAKPGMKHMGIQVDDLRAKRRERKRAARKRERQLKRVLIAAKRMGKDAVAIREAQQQLQALEHDPWASGAGATPDASTGVEGGDHGNGDNEHGPATAATNEGAGEGGDEASASAAVASSDSGTGSATGTGTGTVIGTSETQAAATTATVGTQTASPSAEGVGVETARGDKENPFSEALRDVARRSPKLARVAAEGLLCAPASSVLVFRLFLLAFGVSSQPHCEGPAFAPGTLSDDDTEHDWYDVLQTIVGQPASPMSDNDELDEDSPKPIKPESLATCTSLIMQVGTAFVCSFNCVYTVPNSQTRRALCCSCSTPKPRQTLLICDQAERPWGSPSSRPHFS